MTVALIVDLDYVSLVDMVGEIASPQVYNTLGSNKKSRFFIFLFLRDK